jgi:hypothetical protein
VNQQHGRVSVVRRPVSVLALLVIVAAVASASTGAASGRLPGATAFTSCAAAGPYWPTMTLAVKGSTAWVACKERALVLKVDTRSGKAVRTVRLGSPVIAVTTGFGSVWALEGVGTLVRIAPGSGRVLRRIELGTGAAYNVWTGAGSVWVVDDSAGLVLRVAPAGGRVTARIKVGDGPADLVFRGTTAWIVNHRDRGLVRLDTRTNRQTRVTTLPGDAPERMAYLAGSLWVTGRGTDLLQVDPESGTVGQQVDIGASGIDVVAAGGALWVPSRSAAVDPTGFPTMEALRRVTPDGTMTTVARARGRVDVHGLASAGPWVWLADNTGGLLYRVPLRQR